MNLICTWQEKLAFTAKMPDGLSVTMDALPPLGKGAGPAPKQLALAAICGCTGMDVVSLLRKHKQNVTQFEIGADAPVFETHPHSFKSVSLVYRVRGEVDPAVLRDSISASMTKFCAVSAMISQAAPISYTIELNGAAVGTGEAAFNLQGRK